MFPLSRQGIGSVAPTIALAILAATGCGGRVARTDGSGASGGLAVPSARLDFGEVQETRDFTTTIPVRNTSDRAIAIQGFNRSCDCVSIVPKSVVIGPGGTTNLTLLLDLRRETRSGESDLVQPYSALVRPMLEGSRAGPLWRITGRVGRWIQLSTDTIHLDDVVLDGGSLPPQTISVRGRVPLRKLTARCDPALGTVQVRPDGEDSHIVEVSPATPKRIGRYEVPVTIDALTVSGAPIRANVMIDGSAVDLMASFPRLMTLGAVPIGQVAVGSVTLSARDGRGFLVRRIEHGDDSTQVEELAASPHEAEFRIRQRATQAGESHREIRFRIETEDGRNMVHHVSIHYYGLRTTARVSALESSKGD